jgi:hypothetical protein
MIIRNIFIAFSLLITGIATAQNYSSSPFSSQGIGEDGPLNDGQFSALGNAKSAVIDSIVANTYNPASYAFLSKGQPLFAMGLASKVSNYTLSNSSARGTIVGLSQIALVIPLNKRLGIAGGLQPFARRGYSLGTNAALSTDSVNYSYIGSGSVSKVFAGLSYKLIATKRQDFAIGANLGYLFGGVSNERRAVLKSNAPAGAVDITTFRLHSMTYNFGGAYRVKLDEKGRKQFTLAGTFTPEQTYSANLDYGLFYGSDAGSQTTFDTLIPLVLDRSGTITYPQSYSVGINYTLRPNHEKLQMKNPFQLALFLDYSATTWENYSTSFTELTAPSFTNSSTMSIGFEYIPVVQNAVSMNGFKGFASQIRYRIGGYNAALPYSFNNRQVIENAVSFGFGIPLSGNKTNSSVNLSMLLGKRGTGTASDISERFYSVNIGIVLAPSSYERWFKKYKLD